MPCAVSDREPLRGSISFKLFLVTDALARALLGYGLEYGYSIVEKIKQAAFDGDTMLNMPIIAFIGEETCKAKEAKSEKFDENWGIYEERAAMWEISAASAMICAGVNLLVLWNPDTIKTLKGLIK